jgi:hypothetical protein
LSHTASKALATSKKNAPVSRLSSKFLLTLLTRRVSCSVVLCLGRNPNCSSRSSPRSFTSRMTLLSRIFSKLCQLRQVDLWLCGKRAAWMRWMTVFDCLNMHTVCPSCTDLGNWICGAAHLRKIPFRVPVSPGAAVQCDPMIRLSISSQPVVCVHSEGDRGHCSGI